MTVIFNAKTLTLDKRRFVQQCAAREPFKTETRNVQKRRAAVEDDFRKRAAGRRRMHHAVPGKTVREIQTADLAAAQNRVVIGRVFIKPGAAFR